jgi:methanogenic corrinoid protein MtbC1
MSFFGATGEGSTKSCSTPVESPTTAESRARKSGGSRMARLIRTVEAEIVPRLLLSRRSAELTPITAVPANTVAPAAGLDAGRDGSDTAELARLLLHFDIEVPLAYVEALHYRGISLQQIYLQLLAPTARRLGLLWDRDECDFVQVTIALGRLHQVLQRLSLLQVEPPRRDANGHVRRALLATAPGEQHAFGILLVTQFFRQSGWEVWNEFPASGQELIETVRAHRFSLVGLSAATEPHLSGLGAMIRQMRRVSMNPALCVMVGGPLLLERPELARRLGADATACDGREAALCAENALSLLTQAR